MQMQLKIKMFKAGCSIKTLCENCLEIRTSTFQYRDYRSTTSKKVFHNVLQAFCNTCGSLTAIPDQSTPKIGVEAPEMTRMVLGFYIHELKKHAFRKQLRQALTDDFAEGRGTSRISIRILNRFIAGLDIESTKIGMNRSQLIKAMLVRAKLDLLDNAGSKMAKRFYDAAHLMAA
jgi:hypothetical protein